MGILVSLILALVTMLVVPATTVSAQDVIPIEDRGGLHSAYVVPRDRFERVDVQLIVLSGNYDDPNLSGIAHLTEHLAAFSADRTVLRRARERDVNALIFDVATVYTNSGAPEEIETLLQLSRAVLDRPDLPPGFAESEIKILHRETLLRERNSPNRWLRRRALKNLFGSSYGRANNVIEDLPRLNLEDAYKFHEIHYVPSNVSLIISGDIEPDEAAKMVAKYFGDTDVSAVPEKPWHDQKPDKSLRTVEELSSDRLSDDTVALVKFVDFEDRATSIDLQGEFFLATTVLNNRIWKALFFEDTSLVDVSVDWFFSKVADVELSLAAYPMPGVDLHSALALVEETLSGLLDEPITREEIEQARREENVYAENASRRTTDFLRYLRNVAMDGFAPVTPTGNQRLIESTSDEDVIRFARKLVEPAATSIVLASTEK